MLNKALELAKSLPYERGKQRVAAIAVDKRGRVLSAKTNSYTCTHPKQKHYAERAGNKHKNFLHAEIRCIISAQKVNGGKIHKLYVARSNKVGEHLPSRPCCICQLAISEANIQEVIYYE